MKKWSPFIFKGKKLQVQELYRQNDAATVVNGHA